MSWKLLAVGAAAVLVMGCSRAAKTPMTEGAEGMTEEAMATEEAEEVSFTAHIAPILASKCVRCHSGETPPDGILLGSYEELKEIVVAGKPEESKFYQVISGPTPKMPPKGNPPLPEKLVQLVRDWIAQGAKNN